MTVTPPQIFPLSLDGVLVRFGQAFTEAANARALALHGALLASPPKGFVESAPALAALHVRFDRTATTRADFEAALRARLDQSADAAPRAPSRIWHIPAAFGGEDGPQLDDVAARAGLSAERLVTQFCETDLSVLALGFAPGLPYLGTLPENWQMPRLTELTREVPRGAITTAIRQIVLFSAPSPTGWRWFGRTAFRPFDLQADQPIALRPGDALRFHAVCDTDLTALEGAPLGGARLEVGA
ncbi:carboxyltransferase domain-containing protein [Thioclava sp. A2]|uniref:5-oxoprolinase subunit B family protein n=1 Tax=Thioclava sp. FCG-A2 TaxID=3080562 RepID=UPI002954AF5B|nr:carboxyltransferase domain-containing protein [Thioclava sp. A2]MDV7269857.1 carboxyltransferase domain-containing protein [Thioclava sp. A2]